VRQLEPPTVSHDQPFLLTLGRDQGYMVGLSVSQVLDLLDLGSGCSDGVYRLVFVHGGYETSSLPRLFAAQCRSVCFLRTVKCFMSAGSKRWQK
jgi:hypothetical protein